MEPVTPLGVSPSGVTGVALETSASALGGDVRPKPSGRKKSMTAEAIPRELGSPHRTQ